MIIMPSFFRRVCKAAKLFLCCSQHTMEYLPQLDPQLNNSKPDEGWSDDVLSSSESYQEKCSFILSGEMPVESVGASTCLCLKTASKLDDSTPDIYSKNNTERLQKRKGVCSFFRRVWRAMKPPFHSKNKMEPFVPPPELDDPELSPDPESSDFIPTNENILLRKPTLELKLTDFGCGQLLSSNGYDYKQYRGLTSHLFIYGKFYTVSTNVWALGVLLYEMINRCFPFCDRMEIMQAKVRFETPDLSKGERIALITQIQRNTECCDLILQCLTRDLTEQPILEQILQHDWFQTVDLK
ncbi:Serine/threonine-protein kinase pim-2 [Labeo rohita]|uniref:non-specific serine/threonine protein kinase n=1 Tax=Labeo rohita TaxID=84645 RepID=A0ABQ8M3W6_LABRO|nr:Serine/threonine-protein kinase pim-2 [Labeo rohita]